MPDPKATAASARAISAAALASSADPAPGLTPPGPGLRFGIARTVEEVIDAWRIVYRSHLVAGFIHPNLQNIHFPPQAVGPHTAVILARIDALIVSTMTAIVDVPTSDASVCHGHPGRVCNSSEHGRDGRGTPSTAPTGLPLDRIFPSELAKLRSTLPAAPLVEFGLFADRRKHIERTLDAVFQHMTYVVQFARAQNAAGLVVGLHPDHVPFFSRAFGFTALTPIAGTPSPLHRNHPITLLHLPLTADALPAIRAQHPALHDACSAALPPDLFATRFPFDRGHVLGTEIDQLLASAARAA